MRPGAVQDPGLDIVRGDLALVGRAERLHAGADRRRQIPALLVLLLQRLGQILGMSADRDEPVLVGDAAVEQHVVERGARDVAVHLSDQDLDLVRLHLLGEDRRERLGVRVGEIPRLDVLAAVGVPAQIRVPDPGDAQVLELAVLAHAGERDPVVDLADLVQRRRRVLCHEQQPVGVLHADDRPAARDALVGVLGSVLHHLVGRDIGHERHLRTLSSTAATAAAISSSGTSTAPDAVTASAFGKILADRSGPPVATSSSAASIRASAATRNASSRAARPPPLLQRVLGRLST